MISLDGGRQRDQPERPIAFELGHVVMTLGADGSIPSFELIRALRRHARGDWGALDEEDRAANDRAVKEGTRLFSSYHTTEGVRFWIITEADRSVTTVLLPDEY